MAPLPTPTGCARSSSYDGVCLRRIMPAGPWIPEAGGRGLTKDAAGNLIALPTQQRLGQKPACARGPSRVMIPRSCASIESAATEEKGKRWDPIPSEIPRPHVFRPAFVSDRRPCEGESSFLSDLFCWALSGAATTSAPRVRPSGARCPRYRCRS